MCFCIFSLFFFFLVGLVERCPVGPERKVCRALCRLRTEEDEAKQVC